tara:strand:- start:61 stop:1932 length:1872 start_codon:yes stop_codon:yes gene_type:complete
MANPRDLLGIDLSTLSDSQINSLYESRNQSKSVEGLETLGSITGGIAAGAAAGTLGAGPVGTILGGIAGGMAGAFGGELLEDIIEGKEKSYVGAAEEALISGGFDVATLGAGKLIKPVFRLTGAKALGDKFGQLMGVSEAAQGSKASLAQTQKMLEEGGSSLNPRAIEDVGFMTKLLNEVAEVGMISRRSYEADRKAAANIIKGHIDGFSKGGMTSGDLGESLFYVVNGGRNAASKFYGEELEKIIKKAPSKSIFPTNTIGFRIGDFQNKYMDDTGSILHKETQKIFEEFRNIISPDGKALKVNAQTMLNLQKRLNGYIDDAMPGGANQNSTVVRELTELSQSIKQGIEQTLEKQAPSIYKDYANLNSTFKDLTEGILPEINAMQFRRAKKGDFDALGNLLLTQGNSSKINKFMGSIDKSFDALEKAGAIKTLPKGLRDKKNVKSIIRASFTRNMFGDLTDEKIFNQATVNKFNSPKNQKIMSAIYKEDWPQFKRVLNAVGDSLRSTEGGILSLALRGRELGAIVGVTAIAGGTTQDFGNAGLAAATSATTILGLPAVLYHLSKNPKAVSKLIAFEKRGFKPTEFTPEFITSSLAKVFAELNSEDRKAIKEEAYNAGNYNLDI